jgi:DNA-binding NarL/FixJ family response regulator
MIPHVRTSPITVALLSGSRLVRSGLRSVLHGSPHIDLVGEVINSVDAQSLIAQSRPDVIVIQMEADLDLIGLVRHIQAMESVVRTVLLLDIEDTRRRGTC